MGVVIVPLDQPEEWRAALAGIPHGFGHTWESCHALSLTSGGTVSLFCYDEPAGRAVCPFIERPFDSHIDVVTPYGFSGFAADARVAGLEDAWRSFARGRGYVAAYVGLHPLFSPEWAFADDRVVSNAVYLLDLTLDDQEAWRRLSENRRREVTRWERDPPQLDVPPADGAAFVRRHFRECHRARGASEVYMLTDATLDALAESENVLFTAGASGGAIQAVCMFGCTPYEGQYLFNVCTEPGRAMTTGLLWEGARRLRDRGVPWLNLGGGIRADPTDGVAAYKARFGAERRELTALQQVFRPDVYADLCRLAGVAADAAGYFPAYRRGRASS